MPLWEVNVAFADMPDITHDEAKLDTLMGLTGGGLTYNGNLRVFNLHWDEEAEELDSMIIGAVEKARGFLREVGHGEEAVIRVEVSDGERPTETGDLYRYADIAFHAGVSRQRIAQLAKTDPDFPLAIMTLRDGTPLFRPIEAINYGSAYAERSKRA